MSKLTNILEALRNYQPENRKSLADIYFDKDDRTMTWLINNLCNFNCPYCGRYTKEDPDAYKYSPQHIADCFNRTKKTWHIIISGGEPFLHKHLIEICRLLTQQHYISINTNLSLPEVLEFADAIDPARVILFNASIHYAVRLQRNILDEFTNYFLYLQNKGFNIVGSYVVYPNTLERYKDDLDFLISKGLKQVSVKVFDGIYEGKKYPMSYSDKEIEELTQHMSSEIEMPEYLKYNRFKGLKCSTGRKMFSMKPNGDLERCLSDYSQLGNFFTNKYHSYLYDKKCKTEICQCPYQGMLFSKKNMFL